jgi:predicted  nucleic acid-binding Zn-ribbon protein
MFSQACDRQHSLRNSMDATTEELVRAAERIDAEARKLRSETNKLQAEVAKLDAERAKLLRERWYIPVTVAIAALGAAGAIGGAVVNVLP